MATENGPKTGHRFAEGNPGGPGRPRKDPELKAKCKDLTPLVLEKWKLEIETMGKDWVRVSELAMAYAHGKPAQSMEVSGANGAPLSVVFVREGAE